MKLADAGRFPLILGGDHACRWAAYPAWRAMRPSNSGRLFVLWLDAHSDFNSPETSPSGNIHGMPVAFFTRPG